MSSWPLNGKKGGNRKHSKIDTLPPEMKATVEEMIMDGSATYSDIVAYLEQQGYTNAENHLQIICIRSVVQAVADAVLAVCKERKLTDAKLYTSHWA